MRPALVLFAVIAIVACGAPDVGRAPSASVATVPAAADEITLDIPELL